MKVDNKMDTRLLDAIPKNNLFLITTYEKCDF